MHPSELESSSLHGSNMPKNLGIAVFDPAKPHLNHSCCLKTDVQRGMTNCFFTSITHGTDEVFSHEKGVGMGCWVGWIFQHGTDATEWLDIYNMGGQYL